MDIILGFVASVPIIIVAVFANSFFGNPVPSDAFVVVGFISFFIGYAMVAAIKNMSRRLHLTTRKGSH